MTPSNKLEVVLRYAFLHGFTPEQVNMLSIMNSNNNRMLNFLY